MLLSAEAWPPPQQSQHPKGAEECHRCCRRHAKGLDARGHPGQTSCAASPPCKARQDPPDGGLRLDRLAGVAVPCCLALTLLPAALGAALGFRSLVTVGGLRAVCGAGGAAGLLGTALGALLGASRVWVRLACDGLAPRWLHTTCLNGSAPAAAAVLSGALAATAAATLSEDFLVGAPGTSAVVGAMGAALSSLARRFRPPPAPTQPTPAAGGVGGGEGGHEGAPVRVVVRWRRGRGCPKAVRRAAPPTRASWGTARFLLVTLVCNSLALGGVLRLAAAVGWGWWAWACVGVCVGGCLVCGVGLALQPHNALPTPTNAKGDMSGRQQCWSQPLPPLLPPLLPLLPPLLPPLLLILLQGVLLAQLPLRALALGGGAVACACALWLVWGRTHSLEGALRRALLTGVDDDMPL